MRGVLFLFCLLIFSAGIPMAGQDADTVVLKTDDREFTLLSQISDPKEAAAFREILRANQPALRYDLANRFVAEYPQSWLLAQAYDAAARGAIDLSKYAEAVDDGRFSLRLMPENPTLLVLLANVESQLNQFAPAIQHSSDALEYLDQIERPPGTNQRAWDAVKPQMKASAYFARARSETARSLANKPSGAKGLSLAQQDLDRAAAWNADDPEVFYLRAIVELQLNEKNDAVADLAFVFKTEAPLKQKAEQILLLLSKGTPLELFLKGVPARKIEVKLRAGQRHPQYSNILANGYAGPEACKSCHVTEYDTWRKTGMARMLRPYQAENIAGDFSSGKEYKESDAGVIRMGIAGRPYFEVLGPAKWERFYVDYTIGSKWQQAYATKLPDGRLQVLPIEYNLLQKKWINYWKILDPPGSPRAVLRDFPKLTAATNYQQNCAICHTSQLKLDPTSPDPMQHATYLQPGIDCEMCHGPAGWHVRQAAKGATDHDEGTEPPFDFRKVNNRDGVRVCAQCHRQSAVREIGESGEMNFSTTGNFVPATWLRSYDAFSRKAFYKDGRFRETTFIAEAFTRSACYRRGTAQCATCHSPHQPDFEHNQTSLKYSKNPNEMCLQCHSEYRNRISEHSHHQAGTEASQCVSCHMPRIVNAILFKARSHQIEIPSADLSERFGQEESPNVCLTCHPGKSAGWAKEQLTAWR